MYYKINNYCYKLSKKIKNFKNKHEIVNEIQNHMEDYTTALIRSGVTENQAVKKAIKDMGNTYILAFKLNKCNKNNIIDIVPTKFIPQKLSLLQVTDTNEIRVNPNTQGNILSWLGLSWKDGIISIIIIVLIGNILIFSYRSKLFRTYSFSDVYSFGKVYHIEHIEKSQNNYTTDYIYDKNNVTDAQIRNYKNLLAELGYNETETSKLYKCINSESNYVELSIENGKFIVSVSKNQWLFIIYMLQ